MGSNRLEAFSDGVFAIIITIMVLEMEMPEGSSWGALISVAPVFVSCVLSYIYVGLYWGNHHHLAGVIKKVDGAVLWANLIWLFAMSLTPAATAWRGAHFFYPVPTALYAIIMTLCSLSYQYLQTRECAKGNRGQPQGENEHAGERDGDCQRLCLTGPDLSH